MNATPDIRIQIESYAPLQPEPQLGLRATRLRGVLLTDAELDHTLGLLVLREGTDLAVYGSAPILASLSENFPVRSMLAPYAQFQWVEVACHQEFALDEERLRVRPFPLGVKKPRYAENSTALGHWVIGYRLEDSATGGKVVYAPAVEAWSDELEAELGGAGAVFVDGTFWTDDEMQRLGVSTRTAREMGHVPISGPGGSTHRLASLIVRRKFYVHLNNTNPVLEANSPERLALREQGIEVAGDGMELEL